MEEQWKTIAGENVIHARSYSDMSSEVIRNAVERCICRASLPITGQRYSILWVVNSLIIPLITWLLSFLSVLLVDQIPDIGGEM